MKTKQCTICGEVKEVKLFYKDRSRKDGYSSPCKDCKNKQNQEWTRKNPEAVKLIKEKYVQANVIKVRQTKKSYKERNPEAEQLRAQAYRRKHQKSRSAYNLEYIRRHPEKALAWIHKRRALKAGNGGAFTSQEWRDLKCRYGYKCLSCGLKEPDVLLTADHVIPLSVGGTNEISNIQPLCRSCNSAKFNRVIDYRDDVPDIFKCDSCERFA